MPITQKITNHKSLTKSSGYLAQPDEAPPLPPHCGFWQFPDGTVQVAFRLDTGGASQITIRPHEVPQLFTVGQTAMRLQVSERYVRQHFHDQLINLGEGRGNDIRIDSHAINAFIAKRRAKP